MSIEYTRNATLRRGAITLAALFLSCAATSWAQIPTAPPVPAPDLAGLDLEQLMKLEVVVAASKRAQQTRDVPSFVSVVTAADIRDHGYRTLADVLKTLPAFYVSNDRNYSYIGVRGVSRPGDYSSRILLLLNGLRTNDNIYDQAYIGEEFILDVDLIERIEVIRGPSAALYGSNAFFAVINVLTKQGRSLNGTEVMASAASFGTYAGRASYGRAFAGDLDVLASASYSDSKGRRLYFPEFDAPATNNGISEGADGETTRKFFASVTRGDFSLQATNYSRAKGIPTGAYGTVFNDSRTRTVDGMTLASVTYSRSLANDVAFSTRAHAGRSTFAGAYAVAADFAPFQYTTDGAWWGVDVDASRPMFGRHFLTVGAEYRDNFRQHQKNFDTDPPAVYVDVRNGSTRYGVFAQDEIRLFEPLLLHAGVRFDRYETFGSATSPRVGLIYTPGAATTVKLLAGRAFRAPNEYELSFESPVNKANPRLQPERIETLELVAQRLIGGGVQVSTSRFRNRLSALVNQRVVSTTDPRAVFENAADITSNGVELGVAVNRGRGTTGQLTYSLQRTEDGATELELTNSARHMVKLLLQAPLVPRSLTAGERPPDTRRKRGARLHGHEPLAARAPRAPPIRAERDALQPLRCAIRVHGIRTARAGRHPAGWAELPCQDDAP
jgi:outer membrane cobalamin receptor